MGSAIKSVVTSVGWIVTTVVAGALVVLAAVLTEASASKEWLVAFSAAGSLLGSTAAAFHEHMRLGDSLRAAARRTFASGGFYLAAVVTAGVMALLGALTGPLFGTALVAALGTVGGALVIATAERYTG